MRNSPLRLWTIFALCFLCSATSVSAQTYCAVSANASLEWIRNVKIESIDNTSAGATAGYQDFSSQTASFTAGSQVGISITPGFRAAQYSENYKVFIDFNKNGSFDDAGELIASGSGMGTLSRTFTVPEHAAPGKTRMRVVMRWGGSPTSCGPQGYGEAEDYSVNIVAPQLPQGSATSVLFFESEPGDSVGQGKTVSLTAAEAQFGIDGSGDRIGLAVSAGSAYIRLNFAAPRSNLGPGFPIAEAQQVLRPGVYHDAESARRQSGRAPGLVVSYNGSECRDTDVWGSFTIDQIGYDDAGKVNGLDATFTQRCGSATAPALTGFIRINVPPLTFRLTSDPADFIGGGVAKNYFNSESLFALGGTQETVTYSVSGKRDYWTVTIKAPTGRKLVPGAYATTRSGDAARAGLNLRNLSNGKECNTSEGMLVIHDISLDSATNSVKALHADFVQYCNGSTAAARGVIRHFK